MTNNPDIDIFHLDGKISRLIDHRKILLLEKILRDFKLSSEIKPDSKSQRNLSKLSASPTRRLEKKVVGESVVVDNVLKVGDPGKVFLLILVLEHEDFVNLVGVVLVEHPPVLVIEDAEINKIIS